VPYSFGRRLKVSTELRSSGWLKLNIQKRELIHVSLNGVEKFRVAET